MPSLYTREKDLQGKWHFKRVPEGRGIKTSSLRGPFYGRPFLNRKQVWKRLSAETFAEAKREAADLPDRLAAQAAGATVDEIRSNRVLIKVAVEEYLEKKANKAPKTLKAYRTGLEQFLEIVKGRARFLDEIDEDVFRFYIRTLEAQGYAGKTINNRLDVVYFMLKKNKIDVRLPDDERPAVEIETAIPYSKAELKKLFTEMQKHGVVETVLGRKYSGEGFGQEVRYRFFLGTACRDQEVTFASWADIDFDKKTYRVCAKPDVGFGPKTHEARTIPLPDSLVQLLKARHKNAPDQRWIFLNEEGKPENHFLRKLKKIALRAGLNCGNCKTTITTGRYERQQVEVTCETHPVCEHIYLHRFRKTCATHWEHNNVPVRTIQHWLGHKNLETTMIYLGIRDSQELRSQINEAYGD